MVHSHWLWCAVALLIALPNSSLTAAPRIPALQREVIAPAVPADPDEEVVPPEFTADRQSVIDGRVLISELNCLSCHADAKLQSRWLPKQAPVLTGVGSRVRLDWLRDSLLKPSVSKPGTTMPHVLHGLGAAERAEAVEDLVHFLAGTGTVREAFPDAAAAQRGGDIYRRVGCVACHNAPGEGAADWATSAALPDVGLKYSQPSLQSFLKNVHAVRPSGRMPQFDLNDDEARDLAHYFVRNGQLKPNARYKAYHGSWTELPDFDSLSPVSSGECGGLDLTVAGQSNNFAIHFDAHFQVLVEGTYQFHLGSDDGSRLLINGEQVVDLDGIHAHETERGEVTLKAGWHNLAVDYFQGGGEWTLELEIEGPQLERQSIYGLLSLEPIEQQTTAEGFVRDPVRAERGAKLFADVGCANCHELKRGDELVRAARQAKPLNDLNATGGCLAEMVPQGLPDYELTATQRASIAAALNERVAESEPAREAIHRTMLSMNCYACHQRGQLGGVEQQRNEFFTSSMKEMGDEGRLPPSLTGTGDKLRLDWLRQILNEGAKDRRGYMHTQMPRFGLDNLQALPDQLVELDRPVDDAANRVPEVAFTEPDFRVIAAGRHLVGGKALSCIKCHNYGEYPATGIQAINLQSMTRRIRPEWFHRYMINPQEYRPGTRMPSGWPFGTTTVPDILEGQTTAQIEAVWRYLADGSKAGLPVGLVRESIELKPTDTPVIYRNFIEGAGARAIGVGYPEGVNLAWDANELRLALVWHGAFIDASRHWTGRGQGFEPPLGDHTIPLVKGPTWASLVSPNEAWPATSERDVDAQFLGYRLSEIQQPVFRYRWRELVVEDQFTPDQQSDGDTGLIRTLLVEGDVTDVSHRAATGGRIEDVGKNEFLIDGVYRIVVESALKAMVRESNGKQELLLTPQAGPEQKTTPTASQIRYRLIW